MTIKIKHATEFFDQGAIGDVTTRAMIGKDGTTVLVFEIARVIKGYRISIAKAAQADLDNEEAAGVDPRAYGNDIVQELQGMIARVEV